MLGDPPLVRPTLSENHPLRNHVRFPASLRSDHVGEAATAIGRFEQSIDVHELGLDLDEEERAVDRMPSDEIDHAALAKVVEGRFWADLPPGMNEHFGEGLSHRSVPT